MEESQEVAKSRMAEYKAIEKEVDAEADRLTREELGMPEDQWWLVRAIHFGSTGSVSCARNTTCAGIVRKTLTPKRVLIK